MTEILQHPYAQAFARALVHFVWQGAAIGIVGYVLLRSIRLSASARHATGVTLLAVMLAAPMATTWYFAREMSVAGASVAAQTAPIAGPAAAATVAIAPSAPVSASLPAAPSPAPIVNPVAVLALWLTGVVVLSIRLVGGWIVARRLARRAIQLAAPDVQSLARLVAGRLALDRVVRIVESSTVAVPVMVGWIKPVVILPTAALAGLTPLQVEALLAHELAHVCRHDYLVNLLQSVVETALFYHPAVWWVSGEVRAAREQCCDDLAVGVCDRLVYATALAELAAMTKTPRLALAAADGSLANRVRRILGHPSAMGDVRVGWIPAALLALLIAGVAPAVWAPAARAAGGQSSVQGGVVSAIPGGASGGVVGGVPGDAVPGGVVSGVPGGVVAGVPGGVVSGVPTGVPGGAVPGVVGGVPGGVTEGVPAGVPTGVQGAGAPGTAQEQASADDRAQMTAYQLDVLKAQLADAKRTLERTMVLVEQGLASSDAMRRAEMNLERLQAELSQGATASDADAVRQNVEAVRQKLIEAERNLQRARELAAKGLVTPETADQWKEQNAKLLEEYARLQSQYAKLLSEKEAAGLSGRPQTASTWQAAKLAMLRQLMEHASQDLNNAKAQVQVGTMAGFDVREFETTLARIQAALDRAPFATPISDTEVAQVKARFAEALRKLEAEEARFNVGVSNTYAVSQSTLAALAVIERTPGTPPPVEVRPEVPALSAPAAALRDRVLREGATMSDDAVISVLKDAAKLSGDTDRAEVLLAVALQQTLTPEMVTLYVSAASGIRSDDERARVFKQPVRLRQGKGK